MTRLEAAFAAIDRANARDPSVDAQGVPRALAYGQRMSAELGRVAPDASEALNIAAHGQHIERWLLPRGAYPEGREGYLAWRREQARRHGARLGDIMREVGYDDADCARVASLVAKERLKRDAEAQTLEDVICLVFLRHEAADFAVTQAPEKMLDIVRKTARKMSAQGRARVLAEFALPDDLAACFRDAAAD